MLLVNEIFYSIQGEGPDAGKPAVFLRLFGCNLCCMWCDTKQAWNDQIPISHSALSSWPRGKFQIKSNFQIPISKILQQIKSYPSKHLVITGGEPLLQQNGLIPLVKALKSWHIEVETNGSIPIKIGRYVEQINCSPKLKNSKNAPYPLKIRPKNRKVIYKFVVRNKSDLNEIRQFILDNEIPRHKVYLMPEGVNKKIVQERSKWIIEECKKEGYNFSPRLQILFDFK
jgi:7-carboxy-7-deazaguanine synthase